jgi:hypothetical protein
MRPFRRIVLLGVGLLAASSCVSPTEPCPLTVHEALRDSATVAVDSVHLGFCASTVQWFRTQPPEGMRRP